MTAPSEPASFLFALALLVLSAAGCGGEENGSTAPVDPDVVVEFRSEAWQRAHLVDTGIAALEAEGASADSISATAYQQAIGGLLESRRVLQQGLGSLDTLTADQFDVVSDSLSTQLAELELRVDRAPFKLAPNLGVLKEIARGRLSQILAETAELRADADSTLDAALTSLEQRSDAFADSLNATTEADLDNLKRKIDAGATRAITQFFFDADIFLRFFDRARAAGVTVPIVPGILPVTNFARVVQFAAICGTRVPGWMADLFEGLDDRPETRRLVAATVAAEQCRALYANGVNDFHFYTLNRAELTYAICHMLGVRPKAEPTGRELKAAP